MSAALRSTREAFSQEDQTKRARMSIELCILGSGSGGNCSLLRTPTGCMLIDAGLGPRVTQTRLNGSGASLDEIRGICLTHLDHDHFKRNWVSTIVRRNIRVFVHSQRL